MSDTVNVNPNINPNLSEIVPIEFTREELVVINNILDVATKYEGLRIAETTLFLSKKIRTALDPQNVAR